MILGEAPPIAALKPSKDGCQFVIYGDACSGRAGEPHETSFARLNAVLKRLSPFPQFIIFPGDEIQGLIGDRQQLAAQWDHFLNKEMSWLDRSRAPIYHTTGNHTVYDRDSGDLFREKIAEWQGVPKDEFQLSYCIRKGDLLIVVVDTSDLNLGGEGHVDTKWLETAIRSNNDAKYKIVVGHHPVFPVNGFTGMYQRQIGPEYAENFWSMLVENNVSAYICSHILAFDVQVHDAVMQLTSAGAGTLHRMPEGVEYLHLVQAALDETGWRCQVLDDAGTVREKFTWPIQLPPREDWEALSFETNSAHFSSPPRADVALSLRFRGQEAVTCRTARTLFCTFEPESQELETLWVGLSGPARRLTVVLRPESGRSPHTWVGKPIEPEKPFDFDLMINTALGPGGVLERRPGGRGWSSLEAASPWGAERVPWPAGWAFGHGRQGLLDRAFEGELAVSAHFCEAR